MSNPCIIIIGNLSDGFTYEGPFDDFDEAADHADRNHGGSMNSWIATLQSPCLDDEEESDNG